jgi:pilus assembly protein CpaB
MRSKILILVVALALAGAATVLAVNYLNGARSSIASESEPIQVLVAQDNLPRGLSIEELTAQGLVKIEQVPRRFVAADAVSSARIVEGQVLAVPLSAGEQLTKTRFQFPSQAGLSYTVPEGYIGLTVAVDEVSGVAGLLKPGDMVMLFATMKPKGNDQTAYTTLLIPKARVLAVGKTVTAEASGQSEAQQGGILTSTSTSSGSSDGLYRSVTLALTVADASRVAFVQELGVLQLGLISQTSAATATVGPTSFSNVAR